MKRFAFAALLTLAAAPSLALANDDPAGRAELASSAGRHDEAARELERALGSEGWSTPVLVDLGNAHYRAGRAGPAILAWERARVLSPRDDAASVDLERARIERDLAAPAATPLERAAAVLSVREWLAIGGVSLLAFVLATFATGFARRARAALIGTSIASGLGVVLAVAALWIGTLSVSPAVVVTDGAVVARISPFDEAEPVATLEPGEVVDLDGADRDSAGWERVRTRDGQRAWVPAGSVEPIRALGPAAGAHPAWDAAPGA